LLSKEKNDYWQLNGQWRRKLNRVIYKLF
jgi:hypothetical protein